MHIEVDPDLPEEMAEALDAEGRLIARFTPSLEDAPTGTVALRLSAAAVGRIWAVLNEVQQTPR